MTGEQIDLRHGDCVAVMRTMPDASVDSIVTDPPYHLTNKGGGPAGKGIETPYARARAGAETRGFMGMTWDGGDIAQSVEMWAEALRVLKPGGHLLAFSGSRTYHRMVCAIEDAGFEIRDQIMWVYGSGFPKSKNLDGQWEGWGTALKPAHEPIVVARKPLAGTVAANVLLHGTGALNIDACRVEWPGGVPPEVGTPGWGGPAKMLTAVPGQQGETVERTPPSLLGRWPANLLHDGSEEVLAAFPDAPGQMADASTSTTPRAGQNVYGAMRRGRGEEASADSENAGAVGFKMRPGARRLDDGSAARFFYCAKASREDRNEGVFSGIFPATAAGATMSEREGADWPARNGNHHPTVKPTALMAYLCRLVTPPGGVVLDPFMGSGSTGKAAVLEGFSFIGIDMTPEYVEIARERIEFALRQGYQTSFDLEAA